MTKAKINQFIEELQQHPVIWDTSHSKFKNKVAKDKAWDVI